MNAEFIKGISTYQPAWRTARKRFQSLRNEGMETLGNGCSSSGSGNPAGRRAAITKNKLLLKEIDKKNKEGFHPLRCAPGFETLAGHFHLSTSMENYKKRVSKPEE